MIVFIPLPLTFPRITKFFFLEEGNHHKKLRRFKSHLEYNNW